MLIKTFRGSLNSVAKLVKYSYSDKPYMKWDLLAAVCVERKPILTPELNKLEFSFDDYLKSVEFERSLKCETEVQIELEQKQLELLKKGTVDEIDVTLKQTAQDFIDMYTDELSKFQPASKVTDADTKNDLSSVNRKLEKHLVLVTSQNIGNQPYFLLPQTKLQQGESLRQAAQRILNETPIKAKFFGNAPSGFYKYKYPKSVVENENGAIGAKIFIYFARYINGEMPRETKLGSHKWLDRMELRNTLPPIYNKAVIDMLIDE